MPAIRLRRGRRLARPRRSESHRDLRERTSRRRLVCRFAPHREHCAALNEHPRVASATRDGVNKAPRFLVGPRQQAIAERFQIAANLVKLAPRARTVACSPAAAIPASSSASGESSDAVEKRPAPRKLSKKPAARRDPSVHGAAKHRSTSPRKHSADRRSETTDHRPQIAPSSDSDSPAA